MRGGNARRRIRESGGRISPPDRIFYPGEYPGGSGTDEEILQESLNDLAGFSCVAFRDDLPDAAATLSASCFSLPAAADKLQERRWAFFGMFWKFIPIEERFSKNSGGLNRSNGRFRGVFKILYPCFF